MWGSENWGEMLWAGSPNVPLLGPGGLMWLCAFMTVCGYLYLRAGRGRWHAALFMSALLLVPLAAAAGSVTGLISFLNGTIANADEVNANFSNVAGEINDNDGRISSLTSGALTLGQKVDLTDGGTTTLHAHLSAPPSGPAGGDLTGIYPSPSIASDAVVGGKVLDGSLTGADIQDGSLTGAEIQDGSITGADIQDGSITDQDVVLDHGILLGLPNDDHVQYVLDAGDTMTGPLAINADLSVGGQIGCTGCSSFRAVESGPQNISGSTVTTVLYDSELHDIGGDFDTSTARFTTPSAGVYHVSASIAFLSWCLDATASAFSFLSIDGARVAVLDRMSGNGTNRGFSLSGSTTIQLLAGQTIEVQVLQECGGAPQQLDSGGGLHWNVFSGYRVH